MPHAVVYLHGFASSPEGNKSKYLRGRFERDGRRFMAPDLNCGDFTNMTISKMIELTVAETQKLEEPYFIIGSSLGGYVAALFASRKPENLKGLLLLAPAFDSSKRWINIMGEAAMSAWRQYGVLPIEHFAYGKRVPLSYKFVEDSQTHPPYPEIGDIPCLILHGNKDALVPLSASENFIAKHSHIRLCLLEDEHELHNSLAEIERFTLEFFASIEQK